MTTVMNLNKEQKKSLNLDKASKEAPLNKLLVTLNWVSEYKTRTKGLDSADLDLSVVFKKTGDTLQSYDTMAEKGVLLDSVLCYANKQTFCSKLSDDNLSGSDVQNKAGVLKALGVSAVDKIKDPFDEACLLDLSGVRTRFSDVYFSVTDYNAISFSNLKKVQHQPLVSLSFYDAENGVKIGSDWTFSEQIHPDACGFIIAKLTLDPTINNTDVSNGDWDFQALAESIEDEDKTGTMDVRDIIETIRKTNI